MRFGLLGPVGAGCGEKLCPVRPPVAPGYVIEVAAGELDLEAFTSLSRDGRQAQAAVLAWRWTSRNENSRPSALAPPLIRPPEHVDWTDRRY
jgi:hypothetical protein